MILLCLFLITFISASDVLKSSEIQFVHGTPGALTLPLLSKTNFIFYHAGYLFKKEIVPFGSDLYSPGLGWRHGVNHKRFSVSPVVDGKVSVWVINHFARTSNRQRVDEQSITTWCQSLNVLFQDLSSPQELFRLEKLAIKLKEYDMKSFHANCFKKPLITPAYFTKKLERILHFYQYLTQLLVFGDRDIQTLGRSIDLHFAVFDYYAKETYNPNRDKESSLVELLNSQRPQENFKFKSGDRKDLIDFFAREIAARTKYQDSFVKGLFNLFSQNGLPNQYERDAFIEALAELESEIKARSYRTSFILSPKWKPPVELNEKDREFMKTPLTLLLASTKVRVQDLPDQIPGSMPEHEILTSKNLELGRDFDVFITEQQYCKKLVQWVKEHDLQDKVKVYYALDFPEYDAKAYRESFIQFDSLRCKE